jgi:hypothetical protein
MNRSAAPDAGNLNARDKLNAGKISRLRGVITCECIVIGDRESRDTRLACSRN